MAEQNNTTFNNGESCYLDVSTENNPNQFTLIDLEDYGYVSRWKWYLSSTGYVVRSYTLGNKKYGIRLHRQLLCIAGNDSAIVDHINGNPLDNRHSNLRVVTAQQNCFNRTASKDKKYKGVYRNNNCSTFHVRITAQGKRHYLGSFEDVESAALAYDEAAVNLMGEYAKLNFPKVS